ncbi:hypothetical protein ACOSP7_030479 [Xanthoceras sorbifolium]
MQNEHKEISVPCKRSISFPSYIFQWDVDKSFRSFGGKCVLVSSQESFVFKAFNVRAALIIPYVTFERGAILGIIGLNLNPFSLVSQLSGQSTDILFLILRMESPEFASGCLSNKWQAWWH